MVLQAGQSTLDLGCVRSGPGLAGSHMFTAAGRVCYRLVQRHSASHALTQHVLSDFKRNRERLPVLADSMSDDLDTSVAKVAWLCSPLRLTENTAVIARRRLCSSCGRARLLPAVYRILTFGVTRLDRTVSPHRTFIYCAVAHSATMSDTCMLKRAATPAVPVISPSPDLKAYSRARNMLQSVFKLYGTMYSIPLQHDHPSRVRQGDGWRRPQYHAVSTHWVPVQA